MNLEIISLDEKATQFRPLIRRKTRKLLNLLKLSGAGIEVYLVGKKIMNKNVLAFPAPKKFPRPDKKNFLGEVYLNPSYISKEKLNIAGVEAKLLYMLTHGVLHLLDYDHIKKGDRIVMEKKEKQLLAKLSS